MLSSAHEYLNWPPLSGEVILPWTESILNPDSIPSALILNRNKRDDSQRQKRPQYRTTIWYPYLDFGCQDSIRGP